LEGSRGHRWLAALDRPEVLRVDPVEQLDRWTQVEVAVYDFRREQPVAPDHGAIRGDRKDPVDDRVVRHEDDGELREDGHSVVMTFLLRPESFERTEALPPVEREPFHVRAELRAVTL